MTKKPQKRSRPASSLSVSTDFGQDSVWAIEPGRFSRMNSLLTKLHASGELDNKKTAWANRQPFRKNDLDIRDGVAVIPISGPIFQKSGFLSWLFDGTAIDALTDDFQAAIDDPAVEAVVFTVDSPGGTIGGLEQFAELVRDARQKVPVIAVADNMMASAAYWIGSAASEVVVTKTAEVGSIGVLLVHTDYSELDKKIGIKRTFLTAGKYKAIGNDAEPLSSESAAVLQDELDYLYEIFTSTVAENRGVARKTVLDTMADGRIFIGQQAISAGLADAVGTVDQAVFRALEMMPKKAATKPTKPGASFGIGRTSSAPDVTGKQTSMDEKIRTAISAEQTRLLGLLAASFGQEIGDRFERLIQSGVTVEQFKELQGISKQPSTNRGDDMKASILAELKNSGAPNPGAGVQGAFGASPQDFMSLVSGYQAAKHCTRTEAIQAVMKSNPAAHKAYLKKAQEV